MANFYFNQRIACNIFRYSSSVINNSFICEEFRLIYIQMENIVALKVLIQMLEKTSKRSKH